MVIRCTHVYSTHGGCVEAYEIVTSSAQRLLGVKRMCGGYMEDA